MRHQYPILFVILLLLLPGNTMAKGKNPVLYDATGGGWPVIEIAQQFTDAGLPVRVITAEAMSCGQAMKKAPTKAMIVCEQSLDTKEGDTVYCHGCRTITRLDPDFRGNATLTCHEMMHALTHIRDNPMASTDSCVWGNLDHLGPFDVSYIAHH